LGSFAWEDNLDSKEPITKKLERLELQTNSFLTDTNAHAGLKTATQKHSCAQNSITRIKFAEKRKCDPKLSVSTLGPQVGERLLRSNRDQGNVATQADLNSSTARLKISRTIAKTRRMTTRKHGDENHRHSVMRRRSHGAQERRGGAEQGSRRSARGYEQQSAGGASRQTARSAH
jgi:hypothetical protein